MQLKILEFRLHVPSALTHHTHPIHSRRALLPLLLTSKETYALAIEIWTKKNSFRLVYPAQYDMSCFGYPSISIARGIRRSELKLIAPDKLVWSWHIDEQQRFNSWHLLIAPRYSSVVEEASDSDNGVNLESMTWQSTMHNLENLKIALSLDGKANESKAKYPPSCLGLSQSITTFFEGAITKLRTKTVVVSVNGLVCGSYSTGGHQADHQEGNCAYKCAERIAKGVERLVELKT